MRRRGARRQRFGSINTEGLSSRVQVKLVCSSLTSFPGMLAFFLWMRHIQAPRAEPVGLRNSKGTCEKSQERREHVQSGIDLEAGGLLPTFLENSVQSEGRREKGRVSRSLETDGQTDRCVECQVCVYLSRKREKTS